MTISSPMNSINVCIGFLLLLFPSLVAADITVVKYSLPGTTAQFSSPLIADIDSDSANGKEIVVATDDGWLHAIRPSGERIWDSLIPDYLCPAVSTRRTTSSPALAVLNRSGFKSIVIGYGSSVNSKCDGGLAAFNAITGGLEWQQSLARFAKKERFSERFHAVFSTPAVADVDSNGLSEIAFGSLDRNVYLLNSNGTPRWYYRAADTVWASPAFTHVSGDSKPELVTATDISANTRLRPQTRNGGILYAMRTNQRKPRQVRFRNKNLALWWTEAEQILASSPIAADVIADNPGREILLASGCLFPQSDNQKVGRWIKIFDEKTGQLLRTLPTPACSSSSPAVGDLNSDGRLDVVAYIQGSRSLGGDGFSRVVAWDAQAASEVWNVIPRYKGRNRDLGGEYSSPVIADLDGNGSLEVIVANQGGLSVLKGSDGTALSCSEERCSGLPLFGTDGIGTATPTVSDLDGDGDLEIIMVAPSNGSTTTVYIWSGLHGSLQSPITNTAAFAAPWPMWRGNIHRSGEL